MSFPKLPGEDIINSWYPIGIALFFGLLYGIRSYFRGGQCQSRENLKGKTAIVTGGNSGVGKEIVREFAVRGARVILACRDVAKGEEAVKDMATSVNVKKIKVMKIDLASLDSVRKFVEDFNESEDHLDLLINNAGIMCHPQAKTEDGLEYHFGVNYLGHFLLTHLLLNELKESAPARIINVTALAYKLGVIDFDDLQGEKKEYVPGDAYAQSKLAVMLSTHRLAKELEGTNVTVNVVHPGIVNTNGHRNMPFKQSTVVSISFAPIMWMCMKSARDGAQTAIHCAVAKEEDKVSGKYYMDCLMVEPETNAKDDEVADKLWDVSLKLAGLKKKAVMKKNK